jgi:large subunit ribosomal protein L22
MSINMDIDMWKDKEANAKAFSIKGSVQKVNLVCRMISGDKVGDAILKLRFCNKSAAKDIVAILNSAVANAENNHDMDVDNLYIKKVLVGKSLTLKRFHARARGRGNRILKPFSRVTIYLSEKG